MSFGSLIQAIDHLWGLGMEEQKKAEDYLRSFDPREIEPAIKQILSSNDPLERKMSGVEALLMIDAERNIEIPLIFLDSDESWVRKHLCGFLLDYWVDNSKVEAKLVEMAAKDPDPSVRAATCDTLGWRGSAACIEALEKIAIFDEGLNYEEVPVRVFAIRALAIMAERFAEEIASLKGLPSLRKMDDDNIEINFK